MKRNRLLCVIGGLLLLTQVMCAEGGVNTEMEKYSYAIGYEMAQNVKKQGIELDVPAYSLGVKDSLEGKDNRLSDEEIQAAIAKITEQMMMKHQAAGMESQKAGLEYLEKNKGNPGVKVTASGLQYKIIKQGPGRRPAKTDVVKVHYKGTLIDGKEFDSSYKRGEPAVFPLDRVIPGWTEGLQLMNVGSKYELTVPGNLGYGERGTREIPPNSVLIFEVELLDIVKK